MLKKVFYTENENFKRNVLIFLVFKQTTNGVSRLTGKVGTAFSEMGSQMKNKMMNNNQVN